MTTPFPLNKSTQIAEKSILDLAGRQTYLGNSFSIVPTFTLAATTETPLVLITNASTTAKGFFLFRRAIFASTSIVARYYYQPTMNSASVVVTPFNLRPAYGTASLALVNSTLSVSANGTLMTQLSSNNVSDVLTILDPGKKILITVQSATASGGSPESGAVETDWFEI